ncbi:MAG: excinuclease ABC subunit UvrC [Chloroflexi bacterium]|nr:excinuclease ABC subunit UvrC [Chloroflexota bacterium]MBE3114278.1 excinuclease ABC subunit UvrC [Actinomycetota bacterium]
MNTVAVDKKINKNNYQEYEIKEILKILPKKSGVYIFKNSKGKIIYIGKANNLYSRAKSYFQDRSDNFLYAKPLDFAKRIKSIDYIVTDNETEALILECSLIKKNKPKYNIDLKDDKSYPFIAVTVNEKFPRVFLTRERNIKGAKYFGPYTDAGAVRKALEYLRRIFPVRDCRKARPGKSTNMPCLNYHIKLCPAPCDGNVSQEEYRKNIDFIMLFLKGKDRTIIDWLKAKMEQYSKNREFEKAAELRNKIEDINKLHNDQKIFFTAESTWDFISTARDADDAVISLFTYRSGVLAVVSNFTINNTRYFNDEEILSSFIENYYSNINDIPSKIFCPFEIKNTELISKWLTEKKGGKIEICVSKIGEKKKIMEMAVRNSKLYLEKKKFEKNTGHSKIYKNFVKLKKVLGLVNIPRRIECFDISNLKNTFPVGSMSVALNGKLLTNDYRYFKIKTVAGQDDCRMMGEIVTRRLRYLEGGEIKKRNSFYEKPDLIIIDGGKAQFNTASKLISKRQIQDIDIISIAKKEETIFCSKYPDGIKLDLSDNYMHVLIKVRDEAHRFAVNYHRRLRGRSMTDSLLDWIKGIGEKKKKYIFENISSIEELKSKTIKDLMNIKGLNYKDATNIYRNIHR